MSVDVAGWNTAPVIPDAFAPMRSDAGRFGRRYALGISLAVTLSVTAPLVWFSTRPTELLLGFVGL